jgi:hypothetical protein
MALWGFRPLCRSSADDIQTYISVAPAKDLAGISARRPKRGKGRGKTLEKGERFHAVRAKFLRSAADK